MAKKKEKIDVKKMGSDANTAARNTNQYQNDLLKKNENLESEKKQLQEKLQTKQNSLEEFENIPETVEEIEKQILKLTGNSYEIFWLIGNRLIEIHKKVINDKDSNNDDTINFQDYIEKKFTFSRRSAYNFMFLAEYFNRVQSIAHGSKLLLLQSLDKENREKYLEWMDKENPSRNEIAEKIKEEFKKNKTTKDKTEITVRGDNINIDLNAFGLSGFYYNKLNQDEKNELKSKLKQVFKEFLKTPSKEITL